VRGFLKLGLDFLVPIESHAFALGTRFATNPGARFRCLSGKFELGKGRTLRGGTWGGPVCEMKIGEVSDLLEARPDECRAFAAPHFTLSALSKRHGPSSMSRRLNSARCWENKLPPVPHFCLGDEAMSCNVEKVYLRGIPDGAVPVLSVVCPSGRFRRGVTYR
jgi:hypothetical protein